MGLFGSNYERAGSGIAKNAPKKKGFFRFFEIFGRKFWKLFELNLLYFLSFSLIFRLLSVFLLFPFVFFYGPPPPFGSQPLP